MPLYIEKVGIWSGDTDASHTDFERSSYLAPYISRSGARVITQSLCDQIIVEVRLGSRVQLEQARASAEERGAKFFSSTYCSVEERIFLSILVEQ